MRTLWKASLVIHPASPCSLFLHRVAAASCGLGLTGISRPASGMSVTEADAMVEGVVDDLNDLEYGDGVSRAVHTAMGVAP